MVVGRRIIAVAVFAVAAASCGSGRSIISSGGDGTAAPTGATAVATVPTATVPSVTAAPGETLPPVALTTAPPATTVPAPPTTATPLADLPACPVGALPAGGPPVEILFWHGLSALNDETLTALAERYNGSQDRVRVQIENQGSYDELYAKYAQSKGGDRPDLALFPEYDVQSIVDSGTMIPVGACLEAEGYDISPLQPAALAAYGTAGVQWGMPFNVSNPVLFYNKVVFERAGLDPDRPPQNLQELRDFSQQIVDSGAAAYGVALDSDTDGGGGWYLEQWFANAGELYADNGNGRLAPANKVLYDGPTGVQMMTFVQRLVQDGLAAYVGDNSSGQDNLLKMADPGGAAAMAMATSASLGLVLDVVAGGLIPDVTVDDLGIGPLPGPGPTPAALVGGAAIYLVDGHGDARSAAAWDFLKFLISPAIQSEWAATTGYVPMRLDALEIDPLAAKYRDDPRFRVAWDQLVATTDSLARRGPILGPQQDVRTITAGAVAAIMRGADVQTELSRAAAASNRAITDYNARN
jgi:sn-glycerol 3-phosphate transport system substrate-binding protein